MNFISKTKYFYAFSILLVSASIFALFFWGLKLGIDFKGGTLIEIGYEGDLPEKQSIEEKLKELNLRSLSIQLTESNSVIVKYADSNDELNTQTVAKMKELQENSRELRTDFVGSTVSNELKSKAVKALGLAIVGIAIYIAWAFRKVSHPIPSWQYGLWAIVALSHDIIITLGLFAFFGRYYGVEIGTSFVAALLTILGYSINDTIVVYDRTRENLIRHGSKEGFDKVVNRSLNETMGRSINTSLTVIVVLAALVLWGGETIKWFSIALLIGVGIGTYSSIFVASALLVTSYKIKFHKL